MLSSRTLLFIHSTYARLHLLAPHSPFGLTAPPLSPHLLPSLVDNCVNLLLGTQGRSRRLNEVSFLQTRHLKGDTERLLCPGVLQGLAWLQTRGKNQTVYSRETETSHLLFILCTTLCRGYFYPHCSEMRKHWPYNLAGVTHLVPSPTTLRIFLFSS